MSSCSRHDDAEIFQTSSTLLYVNLPVRPSVSMPQSTTTFNEMHARHCRFSITVFDIIHSSLHSGSKTVTRISSLNAFLRTPRHNVGVILQIFIGDKLVSTHFTCSTHFLSCMHFPLLLRVQNNCTQRSNSPHLLRCMYTA